MLLCHTSEKDTAKQSPETAFDTAGPKRTHLRPVQSKAIWPVRLKKSKLRLKHAFKSLVVNQIRFCILMSRKDGSKKEVNRNREDDVVR